MQIKRKLYGIYTVLYHPINEKTKQFSDKLAYKLLAENPVCRMNISLETEIRQCSFAGFPGDLGPLCFSCPQQLHPLDCNKIRLCDRDQVTAQNCSMNKLRLHRQEAFWGKKSTKLYMTVYIRVHVYSQ